MKLSAPKQAIWWTAVVAGALGISIHLKWIAIPILGGYSFWLVAAAFVLLAIATALKGI